MSAETESTRSQLYQWGGVGIMITFILALITILFYPIKAWIIATVVIGALSIATIIYGANSELVD